MKISQQVTGIGLLTQFGQKRYSKGFTLLELLVTLVIGFVLLSVGIPAIGSFIGNNRITTQANKFTKTIVLARSEAVKRKLPVAICSSTDLATCADSTDWSIGWIVFTDEAGTKGVLDETDTLLLSQAGLQGESSFTADVSSVRYRNTGAVESFVNINYTLSARNCSGYQERAISIRPQGYSTVKKIFCNSEE